jgi:hypothetical protein
MTKRLLNSGFSPKVCSQLLDGLPAAVREMRRLMVEARSGTGAR